MHVLMCLKHAQPVSHTHEKKVNRASEAVPNR